MVVHSQPTPRDLDALFGALADATRRDILARVMGGDASVSDLAAGYAMSFAAVQKHVTVLERAGLVIKRKDGRMRRVVGNPDAVRLAAQLLAQFEQVWQLHIGRLEELLAPETGESHAHHRDSKRPRRADHDRRRPVRRAGRARVGSVR